MSVARRQRTLARPVFVTGFGYFSGRDIRVEFWPAAENAGITFVRHDIGPAARVPAHVSLRIDQPRRTTLDLNGIRVEMVEHALAALAGMRIDNCEVWVDAPEMPGCDGSSRDFVEAIDSAGAVEQRSSVRQIVVGRAVRVGDNDCWIEAQSPRSAGLSVSFELDYGKDTAIGCQTYAIDLTPDSFRREIAPCRTFIPEDAAHGILSQGIGQRVTPRDLLIFGPHGPIDNKLHFPNECARHKLLDVVGDLTLTGCEVIGHIVAYRSGHHLHAELAKQLLAQADAADVRCDARAERRVA
jgi:UDP-3-O-acyl N-acetylglucosamine deacetylase